MCRTRGDVTCPISGNYQPPQPRTHKSLWYHGTLGRVEAHQLIKTMPEKDGVFLVRYSDKQRCDVLTVQLMDKIYHYQIRKEVRLRKSSCLL